jgi:hypothetical protein
VFAAGVAWRESAGATVPIPLSIVTDVAFAAAHESVVLEPAVMVVGVAVNVIVGLELSAFTVGAN